MSPRLSQEQLDVRAQGVGASESAMLLGLSPFGGPADLQARKLGGEPDQPTWAARLGQIFEAGIAQAVTERTGWKLRAYHRTLWHPRVPCMFATPDYGIVGQPVGVEIKKSEQGDQWGDDGDPLGVPVHYRVQAQHQMACLPAWDRVYVAVLLYGRDLRLYPVDRNPEQIAHLERVIPDWWQRHIVERQPVEPDGSPGATAAMRALYPREEEEERIATAEEELLVEEILELDGQSKQLDTKRDELRQRVMAAMGSVAILAGPRWRVTWRTQKGRVEWERLARLLGATDELAEEHRADPGRTLRIWPKRDRAA